MDELFGHMDALESSTNLSKSIKDVEKAIKELEDMRTSIAKSTCLKVVFMSSHSRVRPQTRRWLP